MLTVARHPALPRPRSCVSRKFNKIVIDSSDLPSLGVDNCALGAQRRAANEREVAAKVDELAGYGVLALIVSRKVS